MRLQPKRLRPGEILGLCQGPVVRVKKSMGQNFCIDQNLFREVIERLSPHPSEEIWEIGPGLGSLTEHLIRTGVPVQTFELDERLKKPLAEKFPEGVRFQWGDFLQFPLETMTPGAGNYVVCGNLPYYCGTPIIRKVLWLNPLQGKWFLCFRKRSSVKPFPYRIRAITVSFPLNCSFSRR